MGGLALLSLNWREFFAWSAVTLIFAIALWFHAHAVWSVTTLSDPVSPGWNTGGGWRFVVAAVQKATMFNLSPVAITPLLVPLRSEEHKSELQSLMRISYAVFCLNKTNNNTSQIRRRPRTTYAYTTR